MKWQTCTAPQKHTQNRSLKEAGTSRQIQENHILNPFYSPAITGRAVTPPFLKVCGCVCGREIPSLRHLIKQCVGLFTPLFFHLRPAGGVAALAVTPLWSSAALNEQLSELIVLS